MQDVKPASPGGCCRCTSDIGPRIKVPSVCCRMALATDSNPSLVQGSHKILPWGVLDSSPNSCSLFQISQPLVFAEGQSWLWQDEVVPRARLDHDEITQARGEGRSKTCFSKVFFTGTEGGRCRESPRAGGFSDLPEGAEGKQKRQAPAALSLDIPRLSSQLRDARVMPPCCFHLCHSRACGSSALCPKCVCIQRRCRSPAPAQTSPFPAES